MGLLHEIPSNVASAFYDYQEWDIEAFASRWGGLHTEVFKRVLTEGQDDDKAFAIFAIGYLDTPWAREQRSNGGVNVIQANTGAYITRYYTEGLHTVRALRWSPDGKTLAAVGDDNAVKVLRTWQPT